MLPEYVNDSRLWFPGLAQYLMTDLVSRDQGRRGLVDHYVNAKVAHGRRERIYCRYGHRSAGPTPFDH